MMAQRIKRLGKSLWRYFIQSVRERETRDLEQQIPADEKTAKNYIYPLRTRRQFNYDGFINVRSFMKI